MLLEIGFSSSHKAPCLVTAWNTSAMQAKTFKAEILLPEGKKESTVLPRGSWSWRRCQVWLKIQVSRAIHLSGASFVEAVWIQWRPVHPCFWWRHQSCTRPPHHWSCWDWRVEHLWERTLALTVVRTIEAASSLSHGQQAGFSMCFGWSDGQYFVCFKNWGLEDYCVSDFNAVLFFLTNSQSTILTAVQNLTFAWLSSWQQQWAPAYSTLICWSMYTLWASSFLINCCGQHRHSTSSLCAERGQPFPTARKFP